MENKRFGAWGKRACLTLLIIFLLIPITVYFCFRAGGRMYYAASLLIIGYTMVPFFLVFEKRKPQARELVILAVLSALAVISRAAFIMLEHFKPMVAIIMIAGMAFGPEAGFLVGAVSGFASNFIFGQGPWTPWQMFAFGVAGFLFGVLSRMKLLPKKKLWLAVMGFATVLLIVGPLLDTSSLFTMVGVFTPEAIGGTYLSGLPVNAIHGLCTFLTLFFFAEPLLEKLNRVQLKYGMLEE